MMVMMVKNRSRGAAAPRTHSLTCRTAARAHTTLQNEAEPRTEPRTDPQPNFFFAVDEIEEKMQQNGAELSWVELSWVELSWGPKRASHRPTDRELRATEQLLPAAAAGAAAAAEALPAPAGERRLGRRFNVCRPSVCLSVCPSVRRRPWWWALGRLNERVWYQGEARLKRRFAHHFHIKRWGLRLEAGRTKNAQANQSHITWYQTAAPRLYWTSDGRAEEGSFYCRRFNVWVDGWMDGWRVKTGSNKWKNGRKRYLFNYVKACFSVRISLSSRRNSEREREREKEHFYCSSARMHPSVHLISGRRRRRRGIIFFTPYMCVSVSVLEWMNEWTNFFLRTRRLNTRECIRAMSPLSLFPCYSVQWNRKRPQINEI